MRTHVLKQNDLKQRLYIMATLFYIGIFFISAKLNAYTIIPGTIPLVPNINPATDLVYQGQAITSTEAAQLVQSGINLSELDPEENNLYPYTLNQDYQFTILKNNVIESSKFKSLVTSRSEEFRFIIERDGKAYMLLASKKSTNYLLRKELLRKLGYRVPEAKRVTSVNITFNSALERDNFLIELTNSTLGEKSRWLKTKLELNDTDTLDLEFQDMLIVESDNTIYNLSSGVMPNEIANDRRVLRSLLIPYAFSDIPESINLLSTDFGSIYAGNLNLNYEEQTDFNTSFDDYQWIAKKFCNLKRSDFYNITRSLLLPPSVSLILNEKLIERRNNLIKNAQITCDKIETNLTFSNGTDLKNGKILAERYPNYASRFSFGDPTNPLTGSELFRYFRSMTYSTLISNMVGQFNALSIFKTPEEYFKKKENAENFQTLIKQMEKGQDLKIPLHMWFYPTAGVNFILGREIVTGSYQGNDSVIQLVDQFGAQIDAGLKYNIAGINTKIPVGAGGKLDFMISRVYSHSRPIIDMKAALKYPYKNMLVPYFKRNLSKQLKAIGNSEYQKLSLDEKKQKLKQTILQFKELLAPGELITITDTLGGGIFGGLEVRPATMNPILLGLKGQLLLNANRKVVKRLSITRVQNSIHIYDDLANTQAISEAGIISFWANILSLRADQNKADNRTHFYKLEINEDNDTEEQVVATQKNLVALKEVLLSNDLEYLKSIQKAINLKQHINEKILTVNFLFSKNKEMTQTTTVNIQNPNVGNATITRNYIGKSEGNDYQQFSFGLINGLFDYLDISKYVGLSTNNGQNPGTTIFGNAHNHIYEYDTMNEHLELDTLKSKEIYNGWSISKKGLNELIKKINNTYNTNIFNLNNIIHTNKITLYTVTVTKTLYQDGITKIQNITCSQVKSLIQNNRKDMTDNEYNNYSETKDKDRLFSNLICKKLAGLNSSKHKAMDTAQILKMMEDRIKLEKIIDIIGKNNLFIIGKLEGFREKDENGDTPLISNSIGEIGSPYFQGPIDYLKKFMGINEGELLSLWLSSRVI